MKRDKKMVVRKLMGSTELETRSRTLTINFSAKDMLLVTLTRTTFTSESITAPLDREEALELLHGLQHAINKLWPEET